MRLIVTTRPKTEQGLIAKTIFLSHESRKLIRNNTQHYLMDMYQIRPRTMTNSNIQSMMMMTPVGMPPRSQQLSSSQIHHISRPLLSLIKGTPPSQFDDEQFDDAEMEGGHHLEITTTTQQPSTVAVAVSFCDNEKHFFCKSEKSSTIAINSPRTTTTTTTSDADASSVESMSVENNSYNATTCASKTTSEMMIQADERNENDVLLGRGKGSNNYIGNRKFRELITQHQQQYVSAKRKDKPVLAKFVSELVRSQDPPGRFLQYDTASQGYYEVSAEEVVRKTSQALREGKSQRNKRRASSSNLHVPEQPISPSTVGPLKKRFRSASDSSSSVNSAGAYHGLPNKSSVHRNVGANTSEEIVQRRDAPSDTLRSSGANDAVECVKHALLLLQNKKNL